LISANPDFHLVLSILVINSILEFQFQLQNFFRTELNLREWLFRIPGALELEMGEKLPYTLVSIPMFWRLCYEAVIMTLHNQ
jgi:hypothetical protein